LRRCSNILVFMAVSRVECTGNEERLPQRIVYTLPNLSGDPDGEVSSEAARIQARYAPVVRHCLAENLWDPSKQCASRKMYRNKVVIIGASNAALRDQHQTPIGSVPGALVLNAIRSSYYSRNSRNTHFGEKWQAPDGQRIVTTSVDHTARVYRIVTLAEIAELQKR
jgi:hypothetical protein